MTRIYGAADIAAELGVSRPAISNAVKRGGDVPPAMYVTGQGRLHWDEAGLERWRQWQLESARRGNGYLR